MNLSLKAKCCLSLLLGLGLSLLLVSVAQAQCPNRRCYVDAGAGMTSPVRNGMSWGTAYTNLQDALVVATAGDEIWVAAGVYYPDEGGGQTDNARTASFAMKNGVRIYGGFAATETLRSQRQPSTNVTVLSGDIDRNDITDGQRVVTVAGNIRGSNAYNVILNRNVNHTALLDGFTITAGYADDFNPHDRGGGMANLSSHPHVSQVIFSGNFAATNGGGMYNEVSSPVINQSRFIGNHANRDGGGMSNEATSNPHVSQVIFSGNRANTNGGGMFNSPANPHVSQVIFSGNHANGLGGGMYNVRSNPHVSQVSFSGNRAEGSHGGGGMFNFQGSNPHISNSIFWGNAPTQIVNAFGSTATIRYTLIQGSGGSGSSWVSSLGTDGGHNLDADPLFQVPINPHYAPTPAGNLRLSLGSPAIDAGDNSATSGPLDLEGAPRIQRRGVDLGAYERPGPRLSLNKAVSSVLVQQGQRVTYTLVLRNSGGLNDTVRLSDTLPSEVEFAAWGAQGGAVQNPNNANEISWQDTVTAGESIRITFAVTNPNSSRTIINTAQFSGSLQTGSSSARHDILSARRLYVDAAGTSLTPDGLSWTLAYTNLQDALAEVLAGDEIWVAEGIYYPDEGGGQTNDDVMASFALKNWVEIYGGFAGTETERSQRQPSTNVTVLSGDIDRNDGTDSQGVVTTTANISGANAYHVIYNSGVDSTAVLDGFTITAGRARGDACPDACGGGMYNDNSSHPKISQVSFSGNRADNGGGMYNDNSSPQLTQINFSGNRADNGGGMYNDSSRPEISQVTFSGNRADNGGGMYNLSSHPPMRQVTFKGNRADNGGGMYNSSSLPHISQAIFSGNRADNQGGGMYNHNSRPVVINQATFSGNFAQNEGGGIFNNNLSGGEINNSIFWRNEGQGQMGVLAQVENGRVVVRHTLLHDFISNTFGQAGEWRNRFAENISSLPTLIDADPLFEEPIDPADAPTTAGNLRLRPGSPAINAGDNRYASGPLDLEGAPRIIGGRVDMGAYEKIPGPHISLSKAVSPVMVEPDQRVTYTLVLRNIGELSDSVRLSDTLPSGVEFAAWVAQGGAVITANEISWQGIVTAGRRIDIIFAVTNRSLSGPITNTAQFIGSVQTGSSSAIHSVLNVPPLAADDTYSTAEDTRLTIISPTGVLSNDDDRNGDSLTATVQSDVSSGTLDLQLDGSFVYTPPAQFNGQDYFSYQVSDGVLSDTASVTITIRAVNDGPVAFDDRANTDEDVAVSISVLSNDTDIEDDSLSLAAVSPAQNGRSSINGRQVVYSPRLNFVGTDSFTYRVSDGSLSDTALVTITIAAVNDAPVAFDDRASTKEDEAVSISVLSNDADVEDDSLSLTAVSPAQNGRSSINGRQVVYSPRLNFVGTDSFTYRISDGSLSDTASVVVTIEAVNDAPLAEAGADQSVRVNQRVSLDGSRSSDIEGDALGYGWQQTGGVTVTLNRPSLSRTTFIAPALPTLLTFRLSVTDEHGLPSRADEVVITVIDEAIAALRAQNTSPTELNEVITFIASLIAGDNVTYRWDFGDGDRAVGQIVTHFYIQTGTYTAKVEASNSTNSLTATTGVTITDITERSVITIAGLRAQNTSPTVPKEVITFTADITAGDLVKYRWDFGDGFSAVGQRVTHRYTQTGRYTATVLALNSISSLTATTGVTVAEEAIAGLRAQNSSPTAVKEVITFIANITAGTKVSYTWHFGDGGRAAGQSVSHIYTQAGRYTATVVVSNSTNTLTATTGVRVTDEAIAGLSVQNSSPAAAKEVITFTAHITAGEGVTYTWDFGDGGRAGGNGFAVGQTVPHVYTQAGRYTATVVVSNSTNRLTATTGVRVTDEAIAGLRAQNSSPAALNEVITFTAHITAGERVNYTWDFGDGFRAGGQEVTYLYRQTGTYTATVEASNSSNRLTATTEVTITDITDTSAITIAGLSVQNSSPTEVKEVITFTVNITAGEGVNYRWDFGDGFSAVGQRVTHLYTQAGRYTATVLAINSINRLTATTGVTVIEAIAGLSVQNSSPTAAKEVITFTAHITAGTNVSYTWHFGDGFRAAGQSVSHVYTEAGRYTARVVVSNSINTLTATTGVTVTDEAIAGLRAQNSSPAALNEVITFTAHITAGENVNYTWDFGDGGRAGGQEVTYLYLQTGTYTATVLASNSTNRLTATTGVTVTDITDTSAITIAGLSVQNSSLTTPKEVITFTANITAGEGVNYRWDFGDGFRAVGQIVSHVYPQTGTYTARVLALNSINRLTATTGVTVTEAIAGLSVQNSSPVTLNKVVTFTAKITAGEGVNYRWDFGDGFRAVGQEVTHVYSEAGRYIARVVVSNSINSLTATTGVTITDEAIAGLSVQNSSPTAVKEVITFTAHITAGTNVSYTWDFGDGGRAVGQTVTHVYSQAGTYTATVVVSNSINRLTATTGVTVTDEAIAGLSVQNSPVTLNEVVTFTANIAAGTNVSYTWDFGDGGSAVGQTVPHVYRQAGTYTATVVASNSINTLTATTVVSITPSERPEIDVTDYLSPVLRLRYFTAYQGVVYSYIVKVSPSLMRAQTPHLLETQIYMLSAPHKPAWLDFVEHGDNTGTLRGVPGAADRGEQAVTILATDGQVSSTAVFTITVGPNQVYLPLVLGVPGAAAQSENEVTILATDGQVSSTAVLTLTVGPNQVYLPLVLR